MPHAGKFAFPQDFRCRPFVIPVRKAVSPDFFRDRGGILAQEPGNIFKRCAFVQFVFDVNTVFKGKMLLVARNIFTHYMPLNILALQYLDSGKLSTDVSDTDTGIDWLIYPAQYSQQCQAQSHFVVRSRLDIVENTEIMVGLNQAFYCGTLRPDCRSFRAGIFRQKNISSELLESFGEQITRGGRYIHNG